MKRKSTGILFVLGGCVVGVATSQDPGPGSGTGPGPGPGPSAPKVTYNLLDTNHNGKMDAVDLTGDFKPDFRWGSECNHPFIDANKDGTPEGLDSNCDGIADAAWPAHPVLDTDGDGIGDALDLDGNGQPDFKITPNNGSGSGSNVCIPDVLTDANGIPTGIDLDCDGMADINLMICVPKAIDDNGDGIPDGLDTDCDGMIDVPFQTMTCVPKLLDTDGDGKPDAVDIDCDGKADFHF